MKLEPMAEFFDSRLMEYEAHQLQEIAHADEFYPYTAGLLPDVPGCAVLDLGCGTGLELGFYFQKNPAACVTGIDLAPGMLGVLKKKFPDKRLQLVNGSYFTVPFAEGSYDAAVSVESLHHFSLKQKIPLYRKLHKALKPGGYFILTDYFAQDDRQERENFEQLAQLEKGLGPCGEGGYHFDTPLTREHEIQALLAGGFSQVERMKAWGQTQVFKAFW